MFRKMIERIIDRLFGEDELVVEFSFTPDELNVLWRKICEADLVMADYWEKHEGMDEDELAKKAYVAKLRFINESPDYMTIRELYESCGANLEDSQIIQNLDGQREAFLESRVPREMEELTKNKIHELKKEIVLQIGSISRSEDVPPGLRAVHWMQSVYDLIVGALTGYIIIRESPKEVVQRNLVDCQNALRGHVDQRRAFYVDFMITQYLDLQEDYINTIKKGMAEDTEDSDLKD